MAVRLPIPGQDDGTWGSILNGFLEVSLNNDGTLQTSALEQAGGVTSVNGKTTTTGSVTLAASDVNAVSTSSVGAVNGVASLNGSTQVPTVQLGSGTASNSNFLRGDGTWAVPNGAPNASFSSPGLIQLDGDIGGTATSPTVMGIQGNEIATGTPSNNQVLTYSSTTNKWTPTTPASAPVTSVFGRTGVVTAQSGDYTAAEVGALPSTDDLSAIASANATAGDISLNSHKITGLANGSTATDAAAFGQIPTALPPNGNAGGDLSGTYPNPNVVSTHLSSPLPLNQGGTGQNAASSAALLTALGAMQAGSGMSAAVATKTGNYTPGASDFLIECNANSATFTVTLPTSPSAGQMYVIKKTDSSNNSVNVSSGSQTIDGTSSISLAAQWDWIMIAFDGTNWTVMSGSIFRGRVAATSYVAGTLFTTSGLTGATAASRYVGATSSGAPTSGTFSTGDYIIDQTGRVWICTSGGSPGT